MGSTELAALGFVDRIKLEMDRKKIPFSIFRQVSNISRTFLGNQIVDHSDVVGASPVGAAPTTSSFST